MENIDLEREIEKREAECLITEALSEPCEQECLLASLGKIMLVHDRCCKLDS